MLLSFWKLFKNCFPIFVGISQQSVGYRDSSNFAKNVPEILQRWCRFRLVFLKFCREAHKRSPCKVHQCIIWGDELEVIAILAFCILDSGESTPAEVNTSGESLGASASDSPDASAPACTFSRYDQMEHFNDLLFWTDFPKLFKTCSEEFQQKKAQPGTKR